MVDGIDSGFSATSWWEIAIASPTCQITVVALPWGSPPFGNKRTKKCPQNCQEKVQFFHCALESPCTTHLGVFWPRRLCRQHEVPAQPRFERDTQQWHDTCWYKVQLTFWEEKKASAISLLYLSTHGLVCCLVPYYVLGSARLGSARLGFASQYLENSKTAQRPMRLNVAHSYHSQAHYQTVKTPFGSRELSLPFPRWCIFHSLTLSGCILFARISSSGLWINVTRSILTQHAFVSVCFVTFLTMWGEKHPSVSLNSSFLESIEVNPKSTRILHSTQTLRLLRRTTKPLKIDCKYHSQPTIFQLEQPGFQENKGFQRNVLYPPASMRASLIENLKTSECGQLVHIWNVYHSITAWN